MPPNSKQNATGVCVCVCVACGIRAALPECPRVRLIEKYVFRIFVCLHIDSNGKYWGSYMSNGSVGCSHVFVQNWFVKMFF